MTLRMWTQMEHQGMDVDPSNLGPSCTLVQASRQTPTECMHCHDGNILNTEKDVLASAMDSLLVDARAMMAEYSDVFPGEKPRGLQPDSVREGLYTIPLESGAEPPFRLLYHLSPLNQEEMQKASL